MCEASIRGMTSFAGARITMTTACSYPIEEDSVEDKAVVKTGGVLTAVLGRLSKFWPVSFMMRALRGLWWLLGLSPAQPALPPPAEAGTSPGRQCRTGRKRLRRATRLLLAVLPRRVQSALGYPVCTSIGCSVSPEVCCSPTKPCGKGNKRKQEDVNDDDEEEQQSWVEALTQELAEEDCPADPDYEPSSVGETDSEEYRTQNDTESDIEVEKDGDYSRIKDLLADAPDA